jgi:hypothetical protein
MQDNNENKNTQSALLNDSEQNHLLNGLEKVLSLPKMSLARWLFSAQE